MKGNVIILTYLPKIGKTIIRLELPFRNEGEYIETLSGAKRVFGEPDEMSVRRDVPLPPERGKGPSGSIGGKDLRETTSPL
jgi:hypothetical protein